MIAASARDLDRLRTIPGLLPALQKAGRVNAAPLSPHRHCCRPDPPHQTPQLTAPWRTEATPGCATTLLNGTPTARDRQTMTLDIKSIHTLLRNGVRDRVYPGAVWAVGESGWGFLLVSRGSGGLAVARALR
ncbi:hypothetical protein San01_61660 [Streptomyces angustmyceticus]|uniref:Uncharacterized protein n=1 Tax=Streptomyces angustmyceticus TaxID=285578 RepID=A0A5J4LTP8_9ACTN|nr:hypothetical protein San01_61660 [Streptomyces angustmyceticus]